MFESTYGFHWAEETISDEFGASRRKGETNSSVFWFALSGGTSVDILEDFIETELSETLSGVSEEGWGPSLLQLKIRLTWLEKLYLRG